MNTRFAGLLGFAVPAILCGPLFAAEPPVSFNRDIRPIMSDTCFHCHGFDKTSREAGMRLDIREEALRKTKSDVLPIVPGKPEESEIIARVFSEDKDELMPPPKAHKPLTAKQKDLIKRWVAEGAKYEAHWAYTPLVRPAVPVLAENKANPVDAFIGAKLAEKQIAPSPEASKARLLRRVSLDLTGLPPSPQEIAAFENNPSPDAYQSEVRRLLASPRFGERMAVWWLDIARYADTVGFHGDQNQRIFPYRDYVINAFNSNKGFDQFTTEQLAGDLLPNPSPEQLVASGYNRLNMMTREGGAQAREYLAKYGAERVRSVAAAWFGSTFGCAECHDHKFDPIKTRDFYELQSFFADVKQWGVYSPYASSPNTELAGFTNEYPFPPETQVESPFLKARYEARQGELQAYLAGMVKKAKLLPQFAWEEESRAFLESNSDGWQTPPLSAAIFKANKPEDAGAAFEVLEGPVLHLKKSLSKDAELRATLEPGPGSIAAIRLKLGEEKPAEADQKSLKVAVRVLRADGKIENAAIHYADATGKLPSYNSGTEILGITGGWKLPARGTGRDVAAVWLLEKPVTLAAGDKLIVALSGDAAAPLEIGVSPIAGLDPLAVGADAFEEALGTIPDLRTVEQQNLLIEARVCSTDADPAARTAIRAMAAKVRECRGGKAWSLITQSAEPITVRILPRGNWQDETGAVVLPATPSFLPARRESTPEKRLSRLDLARWIVSEENPITARTVMNRLWQQFFGVGLSASLDDLGSQGELPSHPELLDWLACEFRTGGWDFKHIIELLVTSGTYKQSSSLRPELKEIDPANRLLASQNPRRLDAEFIRDNALSIAGLLDTRQIGGPSAKPYQPAGHYAALQFPDRDYKASDADEQWRRGLYMHWQRTFLHPMLVNFDAPSRDECAAARIQSNTPQQALTLLNDPTFNEAARAFAARLLADKSLGTDEARLDAAFDLAVAHKTKAGDKAPLLAFLQTQRAYFEAHPEDTKKLLSIGLWQLPAELVPHETAAWTQLCRVLLNAQETITRY